MNIAGKMTSQAAKTTKQTAAAVAKKIAQEHLETLKSAQQQVLPSAETRPNIPSPEIPQAPSSVESSNSIPPDVEAKINADSNRLLAQLEGEIQKIRQQNQQEKMYKAQMEEREKAASMQQPKEAPQAQGKLRRAIGGMKAKIKQMAGKRETQKNVSG